MLPERKKLQRGGISQILSVSDGQSEIESGSVLFFAVHIGFPCLHKSDSPNKPDRKSDRDIFYGLHIHKGSMHFCPMCKSGENARVHKKTTSAFKEVYCFA